MTTHIVYFHGFASSPNSSKVNKLKEHFNVYAPNVPYDRANLPTLIRDVKTYLSDHAMVDDHVVFVGTSLGGYYAAYLSYLFDSAAVVANPSVDPYLDLQQFIGENTNFSTGEVFEFTNEQLQSFKGKGLNKDNVNDAYTYVLVCDEDPIVNPSRAVTMFTNVEILHSSDHQFQDVSLIINKINKLLTH